MNYSSIMASLPRLLISRDAEDYVAGGTMLKQLCEKWGLRPIEKGHKLTIYDRFDLDAAIERKKIAESK